MDADAAVVHHLDLLDEVQDHLAADPEGQALEAVGEGVSEVVEGGEIGLEGLVVPFLLPQQLGFLLQLIALLGELADEALAHGHVHALADGLVVVLDLVVDLGDAALDRAAVGGERLPLGGYAFAHATLQLGQGLGGADAGANGGHDHLLQPGTLDALGRADLGAFGEVGAAVVVEAFLLLAGGLDGVARSTATETGATVTADDEAGEQVADVVARGVVLDEAAAGGQALAQLEGLAIHQGRVSVLLDDPLGLVVGGPAHTADLARSVPYLVADVDPVLQDEVDRSLVPVSRAGRADAPAVQRVGDAGRAQAFLGGKAEDLPHSIHLVFGAEHQAAVFAAIDQHLLQPVAVGRAATVVVAALRVLLHPLHGLGGQVHRVELIDYLDHALVEEALGRVGVEVLRDGLHHHTLAPEDALEDDGLLAVAGEAVELVDEDVVHVVPFAEGHHLAEARAPVRRRVGRLALIHEVADQVHVVALVRPAVEGFALGGDGIVSLGLLVGRDAAVGDGAGHGAGSGGSGSRLPVRDGRKQLQQQRCQVEATVKSGISEDRPWRRISVRPCWTGAGGTVLLDNADRVCVRANHVSRQRACVSV